MLVDNYGIKNNIQVEGEKEELLQYLYTCPLNFFITNILLIYNVINMNTINESEIFLSNFKDISYNINVQKYFVDLLVKNREYYVNHNPYDQEVRELTSIENGDIEQFIKSINENHKCNIGKLAKSELRSVKNIGIAVIALASRAAIRGGLNCEVAFSLSDYYIIKLEECTDLYEAGTLIRTAEYQYTKMVNDIKSQNSNHEKSYNPYVDMCKNYILNNLHSKIYISNIAERLNINKNYLSEIFHKNEGKTIKDYIISEKINNVKNLLIYSKYSYAEISNLLAFSSQSYLGQLFKKHTGFTLRQYRNKYWNKTILLKEMDKSQVYDI